MNMYDSSDRGSFLHFIKERNDEIYQYYLDHDVNCVELAQIFGEDYDCIESLISRRGKKEGEIIEPMEVITKGTIVRVIDDSASDEFKRGDILVAVETDFVVYCVSIDDYRGDFTVDDYMNTIGTDHVIPIDPFGSDELEQIGNIGEEI